MVLGTVARLLTWMLEAKPEVGESEISIPVGAVAVSTPPSETADTVNCCMLTDGEPAQPVMVPLTGPTTIAATAAVTVPLTGSVTLFAPGLLRVILAG